MVKMMPFSALPSLLCAPLLLIWACSQDCLFVIFCILHLLVSGSSSASESVDVSLRRDVLAESFGGRNVGTNSSALLHYLGSSHSILPCPET